MKYDKNMYFKFALNIIRNFKLNFRINSFTSYNYLTRDNQAFKKYEGT